MWFYALIVILLILLMWITRVREGFVNMQGVGVANSEVISNVVGDLNLSMIPEPQKLLKQMRGLLDKYDKPEVWNHAAIVMDKDPGQLARMNLGITN
jgi:hypothetical protein